MKRRLGIVFACLGLLACQHENEPSAASSPTSVATPEPAIVHPRLAIRLSDHAGQPLAASHVEVRRTNHRATLFDTELDGGALELELPGPGAYLLSVAAVDHAQDYVRLIVGDGPVELDMRLGTYAREPVGDALSLRARWIGADGQPGASFDAEAVRPAADARHRLRLDAPEGSTALELQLVGKGGRTFNIPGQRFVYDGDGDYWTAIALGGPTVELELDLDALPPAGLERSLELRGATSYPAVAASDVLRPAFDRIRALPEGADLPAEIATIAADARATVEAIDDPLLRHAAALEWLGNFGQFVRKDALELEALLWVFDAVPGDDPSWSFFAGRLSSAFYGVDDPRLDARLAALAEQTQDPGVLADLLYCKLIVAGERDDEAAVRELYARLADGYPGSYSAFYAASRYDPARPLQAGKPMPEWSFQGLDGSSAIGSASLRGRPYLLDIWASWCGPCIADMPSLHEAYAAMNEGDAGPAVEFVGLSMDASAKDVAKLREQWPMPWVHAIVPASEQDALHDRWSFSGIPTVVLVDAEGTIVAVNESLRGEQLLPTLRGFIAR